MTLIRKFNLLVFMKKTLVLAVSCVFVVLGCSGLTKKPVQMNKASLDPVLNDEFITESTPASIIFSDPINNFTEKSTL